jgi:regulatory protein
MEHTITAIKVQRRNPHRVAIYLDGEYAFGLARIVAAWLTVGRIITDEEIEEFKAQDTQEVAYLQALHLLNYRVRASAEIQKKLTRKGYAENVVTQVMERLQKNGLVDDVQFAHIWIENRETFRPRSRRALAVELRRKGIAEDIIEQALTETPDEEQLAYQAGLRQARRLSSLQRKDFRMKLSAFLGRRGFNFDTILPVVDRLWNEIHNEEMPDQAIPDSRA